ncbi:hypothetical protein FQN60_014706 [Etheostoma spectabile]|uniref:Uncharacterized protein n=1 Tax=Etheostoma spectabile TaxID=54343 RepID=A0A5J5CN46_9PERO|nr:hypothetical protein FQN60_014706 [Etheostoma spectabile]
MKFLPVAVTGSKKSCSLSASAPAETSPSSDLCSPPLRALRNICLFSSSPSAMDNSGKEKEAMQLMAEADKKVKASGSFLGGMFGGNHKVEDACEIYARAANMFKMAKNWSEAINCLNQAIDIYTDMGRFTIAAKHHITIAEVYEAELVDIEKAIAHYEQAADYYKGEESNRYMS